MLARSAKQPTSWVSWRSQPHVRLRGIALSFTAYARVFTFDTTFLVLLTASRAMVYSASLRRGGKRWKRSAAHWQTGACVVYSTCWGASNL